MSKVVLITLKLVLVLAKVYALCSGVAAAPLKKVLPPSCPLSALPKILKNHQIFCDISKHFYQINLRHVLVKICQNIYKF